MNRRFLKLIVPLVCFVGALAIPSQVRATSTILPGWDLLETDPLGTTFGGAPFMGVPFGSFDFGGTTGVRAVGDTDTIVERLAPAIGPGPTIPIELVALHLQSAVPVDFGLGLGSYFITLQSERGGPASTGQMTVNFGPEGTPHGTFNSFFDVFFDIRLGDLNGPIAFSDHLPLTSSGNLWSHEPPTGALSIDGVNHNLNGSDISNDFWPLGPIRESHPTGATHTVTTTKVPEGGTTFGLLLISFGICALQFFSKRLRQDERLA